jgi:hypothetical protein
VIGVFLGPGGPLARLAGETVPLVVGGLGGWVVGAAFGLGPGLAVGAVLWFGVSGALVVVRRRPRLRRLYRIGLLLHVCFWSWQGLAANRVFPPGQPAVASVAGWGGARPFLAGKAEMTFDTLGAGTLAGWGQRPRRVAVPALLGAGPLGRLSLDLMASRDEKGHARAPLFAASEDTVEGLGARALVLRPEGGGPAFVLVRLDLTTADVGLTKALRRRLADLAIPDAHLLVSATHTHSGLGGYSRDRFAQLLALDHFDPEVFERILDAAEQAVRTAWRDAKRARIGFGEARDRDAAGVPILAKRRGGGPVDDIDDRVVALRVELEEGRVLAVLLNYAVHPTAVRRDHMAYDRDIAGAIEERLGWRIPGHPLVLFVNGALGDVAPRVVRSAQQPNALIDAGDRFADAVVPGLLEGPTYDRLEIRGACVTCDLGTPRVIVGLSDRGSHLDHVTRSPFDGKPAAVAADVLLLPVNMALWSLTLTDVRVTGSLQGKLGAQVTLGEGLADPVLPFGAVRFLASRTDGPETRTLGCVWVPCEATTDVGRSWRERFAEPGEPTPMVLGLVNGSMAYLTAGEEMRRGGYEATATLYGLHTHTPVIEALSTAWHRLGR